MADPEKAQLPVLDTRIVPHQALQLAVRESLRHLQANVPGILDSDQPECVHQARVALRRLRSTQKAFTGILDDDWDVLMSEGQWLASTLGSLRDLDVLLSETLPGIEAALQSDANFNPLKTAIQKRRDHYRVEVHSTLASTRYKTFLRHLKIWLKRPLPAETMKSAPLLDFANQAISRTWRSVDRLAREWESLSLEERHDLRKRAKRLRYTIEIFSSLYKRKRVERYLGRLQELQDILGKMNDCVAAQALLAQFTQKDMELAHSAGLIAGWLAHEAQQSEAGLVHVLKRLERTSAFWDK